MATTNVLLSQGGYSCVHRSGPCDNQAEVGTGLTTSGTLSWAAGAGDARDPGAASSGGEDEVGAVFSPDADGVDAGAGAGASALASDGADVVEGATPLGGSGKSQGRATIAAGMILRTHMRTYPSVAKRSHSLPSGCAYHTFTVILSLDRAPLKVDVLREIPHEGNDFTDTVIHDAYGSEKIHDCVSDGLGTLLKIIIVGGIVRNSMRTHTQVRQRWRRQNEFQAPPI